MTKSEKLFEMLQYIREYPYLTAQDLARLCDVSERGVYRYIKTLSKAGYSIRYKDGGYRLLEGDVNLLNRASIDTLKAVRELLPISLEYCDSEELRRHGKEFMELLDNNLPKGKSKVSGEMLIVPNGTKVSNYGGTVTIGHSSKPGAINPLINGETISVTLMNLIFSNLVEFDSSLRPVPGVAKSWEVSEDELLWTFFLRKDVRFHDGHPLTVNDVIFTYESIMNSQKAAGNSDQYGMIDKFEAEGDYTLKVFLKYSFAPLIYRMGTSIVPKHLLEHADMNNTEFNRKPVGSGPFKLTEWAKDDTIALEANRDYFQKGRPILNKLIFKTYPDRQEAINAISQGEMDIALQLVASDLSFISKRGLFRVYPVPTPSYYAIVFDLNDPVLRDARVRKALDFAIDRDSIIKNQLKGYSKICTGPFAVDSWAYDENVQPTEWNIEKAKELLEQAGWQDTDGDGILDKDGEPLEISLSIPNISDSMERISVTMKAQLMKVGIKLKLVYMRDSEPNGEKFQAMLAMIVGGADPDYSNQIWHSKGARNLTSYSNSYVDHLLEQGREITDLEERKAIYHKIHRIIHDDCPAIFMFTGTGFIGSNYHFRNANFSSMLHLINSIRDWQIIHAEQEGTNHERRQEIGVNF